MGWVDPLGLMTKPDDCPASKPQKYKYLREMDSGYGEEGLRFAKNWPDLPFDVEVEYVIAEAERAQYEVIVKDCLLHDAKGNLLDTGNAKDGK